MSGAWAACGTCRYYDGDLLCYAEPKGTTRRSHDIACRHHAPEWDHSPPNDVSVRIVAAAESIARSLEVYR